MDRERRVTVSTFAAVLPQAAGNKGPFDRLVDRIEMVTGNRDGGGCRQPT